MLRPQCDTPGMLQWPDSYLTLFSGSCPAFYHLHYRKVERAWYIISHICDVRIDDGRKSLTVCNCT